MSRILSIEDVHFTSDSRCVVEAYLDDAVLVHSPYRDDPPEWHPALCRGSFDFSEDDVIPSTDTGLKAMFERRIDDWEPIDTSDF